MCFIRAGWVVIVFTTEIFLISNVKDDALKKSIVCEAIVKTTVKLSYTKCLLRTADLDDRVQHRSISISLLDLHMLS